MFALSVYTNISALLLPVIAWKCNMLVYCIGGERGGGSLYPKPTRCSETFFLKVSDLVWKCNFKMKSMQQLKQRCGSVNK